MPLPLPDSLNSLKLPDLWQQEAVRHLRSGRDVVVDAPAGSGKTFVFEMLIENRLLKGQAIYTVPTRALANDKRLEWQRRGWSVGIATGDLSENTDAPVVVATLETQRERLLQGKGPALMVIDEYQMIADPVRGLSYELAIALAPPTTQLLLLSGSVGNAAEVRDWLTRLGRDAALVSTKERPVPLDEYPMESLPRRAPDFVEGFWPRLAAQVLLADLGPLLIFAPRRSMAEKIARQIASVLPADDPVGLTEKQRQVLGKDLTSLLERRVAWHHSGLSYQQRAGVIEPLAKSGQLRVVVATTGLAAGINFSMRSVIVSETRYFDGKQERNLAPDELLQMFGRAGRRGLDTEGYVITTPRSPRLADAAPLRLKRGRDLDWPPLLRVMQRAAEAGEPPFAAAEKLSASLFSNEPVDLGLAGSPSAAAAPAASERDPHALFGLEPRVEQVLNSRGIWEEKDPARETEATLEEAFVFHHQHLEPALEAYPFVADHFRVGRVCRLERAGRRYFGKEVALGILQDGGRDFVLTRNIRGWLGEGRDKVYTLGQIEENVIPLLTSHFEGGRVVDVVQRGDVLALRLDFSRLTVPVYEDTLGVLLVRPDERTAPRKNAANVQRSAGAQEVQARPGTPAYAWRKLGLIEADGRPTKRGVVASFFHQGEGLAIAAALEEASLPIAELIPLLGNLRAGPRFEENEEGAADRLGIACRQTYGTVDYDGYLKLGLPVNYGAGAAPLIGEMIAQDGVSRRRLTDEFVGEGDLERLLIEWLSLLRHIRHAPDHAWPRWMELKAAATEELKKQAHLSPHRVLPDIPAAQLVHRVEHGLSYARLQRR